MGLGSWILMNFDEFWILDIGFGASGFGFWILPFGCP